MATLVLTAVGTAIGGPIGGAVGALIGQAADATIFRPRGREGPRLSDLRVQTSTYGARIPRLHGTMRVSGTVIWSTDLIERSDTSGGGKGQPSVTRYSYSASFAVALSSRPILLVGRIWADGNLLRGAGGDFKTALGAMRVHAGGADQRPDPLIAAAVGMTQASAHRGIAYVVIEDLDLADFGNRIPALTFEVFADASGAVELSGIAASATGMAVTVETPQPLRSLTGYACDGEDARAALRPLIEAFDLRVREDGESGIALVQESALALTVAPDDQLAQADDQAVEPLNLARRAIEDVPVRIAQRYYDPARDYQAGIQAAERPGAGRTTLTIDLPATIDAGTARAMADDRLRAALRNRLTLTLSLGWRALDLRIGDGVAITGAAGLWRVERIEWSGMVVTLRLTPTSAGARLGSESGAPGAAVPSPDLTIGITSLALVELPTVGENAETPMVFAAATGAGAGWRGAALFRMEGDNAHPAGFAARRAVIGTANTVLPPAKATLLDAVSRVIVSLARPGDMLESATDAMLRGEGNLYMIGQELLQFGTAEALGGGHFRLSRLARGLNGTEWAMNRHEPDEAFVLLDQAALTRIDLSAGMRGQGLDVRAIGVGDVEPATAQIMVRGTAMTTPSPVHGDIQVLPDGSLAISWVRRSRAGWRWLDGADVPLGEEAEAYRIVIEAGDTTLRTATVPTPLWIYAAADRSADMALGLGALQARIAQIGTWGEGRTLILAL